MTSLPVDPIIRREESTSVVHIRVFVVTSLRMLGGCLPVDHFNHVSELNQFKAAALLVVIIAHLCDILGDALLLLEVLELPKIWSY